MDLETGTGNVVWQDLTVPDAAQARSFYEKVVGWTPVGLEMDGYEDYVMNQPGSDEAVAGICYARGQNAALPPQWIIYIQVANLAESLAACLENGGTIVDGPRQGGGHFAVIRDPFGAVCALVEPAPIDSE